jgi:SHS2 domain-containing protein
MKSVPGAYDFLPHTADAKFRAYGKTLEEAFRNSARAMFALITDIEKVKGKKKVAVRVKAKRRDSLLFDFLDRLLFLLDTKGLLLHDVEDVKIREEKGVLVLTGTVVGDHYKRYETHGDVKAVTYSDMAIKEEKGGWACQVVVDL